MGEGNKIKDLQNQVESGVLNRYKDNLSRDKRIWIDKDEIDNVFYTELHGYKRWLRPDIITKPIHSEYFNVNPLVVAIAKKILSIKQHEVKSALSFGSNKINVDFSINLSKASEVDQKSNIFDMSKKYFEDFSEIFSNLHRTKGISRGSLNGYQYHRKNKHSFSLINISKEQFEETYNKVLGLWKGSKEDKSIYITDWKYYSDEVFNNSNYRCNNRINVSIIKSLAYEFCLQKSIESPINSRFAVPFYALNCEDVVVDGKMLDCNIQLIRMNFPKIQEIYLNV